MSTPGASAPHLGTVRVATASREVKSCRMAPPVAARAREARRGRYQLWPVPPRSQVRVSMNPGTQLVVMWPTIGDVTVADVPTRLDGPVVHVGLATTLPRLVPVRV